MPRINNKNALPTAGKLHVEVSFNIVEKKGHFVSEGSSKYYLNVRAHKNKMLNDAIYNAMKRRFPKQTVTPYNIVILSYNYIYYMNRYQVIEKDGKYYERFREKNRTRYYVINDKNVIAPDAQYNGIYGGVLKTERNMRRMNH